MESKKDTEEKDGLIKSTDLFSLVEAEAALRLKQTALRHKLLAIEQYFNLKS